MWGIKMGRQPGTDKVTGMLDDELWEDDATATTAASTADLTSLDEDMSDEESLEGPVEEENGYREPPSEPLYNGRDSKGKEREGDGMMPRWTERRRRATRRESGGGDDSQKEPATKGHDATPAGAQE